MRLDVRIRLEPTAESDTFVRRYFESTSALAQLVAWDARELEHAVERAVILAQGDFVDEVDLKLAAADHAGPAVPVGRGETLDEIERATVERALHEHGWNVTRAAQALGVTRQALYRRMEKFGLA